MNPDSSLRSRIARGLSANAFGQLVTLVSQFVGLPVFLNYWGIQLYGEWLVLSAIPAYFALSDVGFSSVAANDMTILMASNDRAGAQNVFQSVWLLISAFSLVSLTLVAYFVWLTPIHLWMNFQLLSHDQASTILFILACYVLVGIQGGLIQAGFRCIGKFALGLWYANLLRLFEFSAVILTVFLGGSPVQAAKTYLLARCFGTLIIAVLMLREIRWLKFGFGDANYSTVRRLTKPAIAFIAFPLGNALSLEGFILVIGNILGPIAVVTFSSLRTLTRSILQIIGMINSTVWPELSLAFGTNNLELARTLHRRSCQVSLWLTMLTAIIMFFAGDWLLHLWTHGKVVMNYSIFLMLLVVVVANSIWLTSSVVLVSINRHIKMALVYLIATALSLVLAYIFSERYGLVGAAGGLLIIDALMVIYTVPSSIRILNDSLSAFVKQMLWPNFSGLFAYKN
jgi:O-antigen/teichoic acid export membrane protein